MSWNIEIVVSFWYFLLMNEWSFMKASNFWIVVVEFVVHFILLFCSVYVSTRLRSCQYPERLIRKTQTVEGFDIIYKVTSVSEIFTKTTKNVKIFKEIWNLLSFITSSYYLLLVLVWINIDFMYVHYFQSQIKQIEYLKFLLYVFENVTAVST